MGNCCRRARLAEPSVKWGNLVKKVLRIRKLQRLFAFVGQYLKRYPKALLQRVASEYTKED